MLLPALSCDTLVAHPMPQRPSRPKLCSFDKYDCNYRSQSPVVGLIASCRALQNMLGERFSSPSPSLGTTYRARPMGSPFGAPTLPPVRAPAPRSANKRGRDAFEDDEDVTPIETASPADADDMYSTPKRRRVVPFDLPPGLMASDFEALAEMDSPRNKPPRRRRNCQDIEMPTLSNTQPALQPSSQSSCNDWTETDDRLLVETVLSKLNLSSREWNDCALRLGKDKDSLGRRWQSLLGEGNVGLRRGSGQMERVDLDIRSW